MTGHLLAAGERREEVVAYRAAATDGRRLLLHYSVEVTTEFGEVVGRGERRAAIAVAALASSQVDAFAVDRTPSAAGWPRPVAVSVDGAPSAAPRLAVTADGGRHTRFVFEDAAGRRHPPFHSPALTDSRTTPWVYPLLPLGVAVDLTIAPVLAVLWIPIVVLGD